ncbi:hypothetical protein ID866_13202 [Astraeus odoratus]|nr:hypothetical protein ID866_13202 [Astraeus odoratus]
MGLQRMPNKSQDIGIYLHLEMGQRHVLVNFSLLQRSRWCCRSW